MGEARDRVMYGDDSTFEVRPRGLNYVKIDWDVCRDGSVSANAKALYMAIASYAHIETRRTDHKPPYRSELAECIGKSIPTVERALRELQDYGLLDIENRYDPERPKVLLSSVYVLLDEVKWARKTLARHEADHGGSHHG